jgi:hypothetical protein
MKIPMSLSPGYRVLAACEKWWNHYQGDCSGFVKAVAKELGVTLTGMADDIVGEIQRPPWIRLNSAAQAAQQASLGLVIAGLKATPNGHVVVVVPGPLAHGKYPTAYWGKLNGVGRKNSTINWAWDSKDRDRVVYAWRTF